MKYFSVVAIFLLSLSAVAKPKTAYDVAKILSEANDGFVGEVGDMEMILKTRSTSVTRKMTSKSSEGADEDRTLLEFVLPKDIAGTKLLTWSFDEKDDQQWIFIPTMRRVKRIKSGEGNNSFMGSEFSYEDLRKPALEKYTYSDLKAGGKGFDWQYVRKAKENSFYTKQEVKVSMEHSSPVEIKFYDRSGELLKVATYEGFKSYKLGKKTFWRPSKITMKNVQTDRESIILWKNRKIGQKINDNDLSKRALKK